ncbi:hypothetical protein DW091_02315 [Eubacterium sp. AM05-23]|uniref:hypothetical protein n=1 Tax=Eubacterium TaxID=1730 RepID=UPI000E54A294|nr:MULTISPECIES: hypothetical protein [Eubacterium]RHO60322.1 hypothetical protein DW091_02315 [Eubacterium sp. AM05-23]
MRHCLSVISFHLLTVIYTQLCDQAFRGYNPSDKRVWLCYTIPVVLIALASCLLNDLTDFYENWKKNKIKAEKAKTNDPKSP